MLWLTVCVCKEKAIVMTGIFFLGLCNQLDHRSFWRIKIVWIVNNVSFFCGAPQKPFCQTNNNDDDIGLNSICARYFLTACVCVCVWFILNGSQIMRNQSWHTLRFCTCDCVCNPSSGTSTKLNMIGWMYGEKKRRRSYDKHSRSADIEHIFFSCLINAPVIRITVE